jgi:hypothetical protein
MHFFNFFMFVKFVLLLIFFVAAKTLVGQSTTQLPSHQNSLMASRAIPFFCLPPGTTQRQRNPEVKRFIRATIYSVNICRQL